MNNILVIGESCRDIFVYCDASRLCPDVPVPVLNVVNQTENSGMAKNVQRNIQGLIDACDLITNDDWYYVTKTRYVHEKSNHMFFRVDSPHHFPRIDLSKISYDFDIIAIADYNKGFLAEADIETICQNHPLVFMDTKKILGSWANKAKYIKINDYEFQNSKPHLTAELNSKIIHTMGGEGCAFNHKHYPVDKVEIKDVSGAGDSFFAALVVKYFQTSNIDESIAFANKCASKVVQERGVTTIKNQI